MEVTIEKYMQSKITIDSLRSQHKTREIEKHEKIDTLKALKVELDFYENENSQVGDYIRRLDDLEITDLSGEFSY